ncbi:MAG: hypothetical protein Kow0077_08570 [Anaerolineae bacterium]
MGRLPDDLSFEGWVRHIFDHPSQGQPWYFDLDADWWDETARPDRTLDYLTRLLEAPRDLLAPYTDSQINDGLWYLLSNSQHMDVLMNPHLPLEGRLRCLRGIETFYAQVFYSRCMEVLGHIDEPGAGPLNSACYMWWDLISLLPAPADRVREPLDRAVLDVLAAILQIDHVACQESALHGLGHWHFGYPAAVQTIIEDFLRDAPHLTPGLRAYAEQAACGCVL